MGKAVLIGRNRAKIRASTGTRIDSDSSETKLMNVVPTVFIVDSNRSLGRRLARLVTENGARALVFTSAKDFSNTYRTLRPSCLVLNIRMPGLRSLEFQRQLSKSPWSIPVIFISRNSDVSTSVRAMRDGALDFFVRPIKKAEFLDAIDRALRQDRKLREEIDAIAQIHRQLASLTIREREVLLLVVAGMLNKQIAAMLGTGEKTIKVHRGRVMEKMKVQSVAQLARLAERARLPIPQVANPQISSEFSYDTLRLAALSLDYHQFAQKASSFGLQIAL